ncbi:hypothetical protein P3L10_018618 [Capsicum annuum]
MLYGLNFPFKFIKLLIKCITSTKYTLALNGGVYGEIKGKRGLRQGDPISSLIFVICVEYFSRMMDWVADHEGFAFHTKCRSLRLNHLCFADDMLLFYKRQFDSVGLILLGLKTFSSASRLCTNCSKSSIFCVNINSQVLENLNELTGYTTGALPLKFLGAPISAKKLSSMDYEDLLDKMTNRIKTLGTRNLSYTGRVQLVNSVLIHIHSYWFSIFLLPKKVFKSITTVCRNFI